MLSVAYSPTVPWDVEYTDQFEEFWQQLSQDHQVALDAIVRVLESRGPALGPPFSVDVPSATHPSIRQLRMPSGSDTLCVLYLIDDARAAVVLLVGALGDEGVCPPEQVDSVDVIYQSYLALRRRSEH